MSKIITKMMNYPPVRSLRSETRCYLRFANLTQKRINIVWVNFSGQYVSYIVLQPGQYIDVNTFKTHPWIAFATETKDKMHLNKNFVYDPQTFEEYCDSRFPKYKPQPGVKSRILVPVTLPVHTLKHTTLLYLKNYLKDTNNIDLLDLPKLLADTLKSLIEEKNNLNTLPLFTVYNSNQGNND